MDFTLSRIIRNAGFDFQSEYNQVDENFDPVVFKFVAKNGVSLTESDRKNLTKIIAGKLDAAKFVYRQVAFERHQRAKGDDYWAFVIRVPGRIFDRLLDRDIHGNLIYPRTRRRAA